MEKISSRIWVLIIGIAVAIAIGVSALALDRKVIPPQASEPVPQKNKASVFHNVFLKSVHNLVDTPATVGK